MRTPKFPEANHPLIKSLFHYSDQELLTLFQDYPEQGKYFIALFCRYSPIVHKLIWHSIPSAVQADYIFASTWRHIFLQMGELNLSQERQNRVHSFQGWLIKTTAFCLHNVDVPSVESINYTLKGAPPPLWCYLESALDKLPPVTRLMIIMAQNFHWSETRIAAYLQAEGEVVSPAAVQIALQEGYQLLEGHLPEDVCTIYLTEANQQVTAKV